MASTKTTLQKVNQNEKAESIVPDEGTGLNPWKTTKWSGDRQPSTKRIQNSDSEDNPASQEINKMQEMFTKDLEELKNKQTDIVNTLEGINSRITKAEEQINNLEDRMLEITAAEYRKKKKKRQPRRLMGQH